MLNNNNKKLTLKTLTDQISSEFNKQGIDLARHLSPENKLFGLTDAFLSPAQI